MMMALLTLKGKIKSFYEKNYVIVRPFLRFFIMCGIFYIINQQIGFDSRLSMVIVPPVLALICGLAPDSISVYLTALVIVVQTCALSIVLGGAMAVFFIIVFLLYGRFGKEHCIIILLIPIMDIIGISYVVPIVAGIFMTPTVIPAIIIGSILKYILSGVMEVAVAPVTTIESDDSFAIFKYVVDYTARNKEILIYVIALTLAFLFTYYIRKMKANHASQIGILFGGIVLIGTLLLANVLGDVTFHVEFLFIGVAVSMMIAYLIQFFRMSLDYTGTRKLQFEDDEYYYYVKAVPKLKVVVQDKTLKRIDPKDKEMETDNLQEEFDKVLEQENITNNTDE